MILGETYGERKKEIGGKRVKRGRKLVVTGLGSNRDHSVYLSHTSHTRLTAVMLHKPVFQYLGYTIKPMADLV